MRSLPYRINKIGESTDPCLRPLGREIALVWLAPMRNDSECLEYVLAMLAKRLLGTPSLASFGHKSLLTTLLYALERSREAVQMNVSPDFSLRRLRASIASTAPMPLSDPFCRIDSLEVTYCLSLSAKILSHVLKIVWRRVMGL